jgi:hypothetical protein
MNLIGRLKGIISRLADPVKCPAILLSKCAFTGVIYFSCWVRRRRALSQSQPLFRRFLLPRSQLLEKGERCQAVLSCRDLVVVQALGGVAGAARRGKEGSLQVVDETLHHDEEERLYKLHSFIIQHSLTRARFSLLLHRYIVFAFIEYAIFIMNHSVSFKKKMLLVLAVSALHSARVCNAVTDSTNS